VARNTRGRHAEDTGLPSREERLGEEVDFWRGFIADWERKRGEPAHPRAYEALQHAEKKLEMYRNRIHTEDATRAPHVHTLH